jgi:hypothetical protein
MLNRKLVSKNTMIWVGSGIVVLLICGFLAWSAVAESQANARCVGTVMDKYNEYEPGVTINTGNSGVGVPTGSTNYFFAIKMSDGSFCSRKVNKATWISIQRGEKYGD